MKKILLISLLLLGFLNAAPIPLTQCGILDVADATYILQNNVTSNGTCFVIQNKNIVLDLNSFTVTYGNWPTDDVFNGGFESSDGWDLANAPHAARQAGTLVPPEVAGGSYSMQFDLGPGTISGEYIKSTQKVRLYPNVSYVLSGMMFGTTLSPGTVQGDVQAFVEIEELGIKISAGVITWRGFGWFGQADGTLPTPFKVDQITDVTIRAGIEGINVSDAGNAGKKAYIDEIHLKPAMYYGVLSTYGTNNDIYKQRYPNDPAPLTERDVHHLTIKNGKIIQGSGTYDHSHAIYLILGDHAQIYNVEATTTGVQSEPIKIKEAAAYMDIHHNVLCNLAQFTKSRDSLPINALSAEEGAGYNLIHDNQVLCSLQRGIYMPTKNSQIYGNLVNISSFYSNNFGIMDPGMNSLIYQNTVINRNGRGIHVEGNNISVYDNYVWVRWSPNQEYPDNGGYAAYGIQLEGIATKNFSIYNNTVEAVAVPGFMKGAHAFRISADDSGYGPTEGKIYNNIFRAVTTNGHEAIAAALNTGGNTDASNIQFYNNRLESNHIILKHMGGKNVFAESNQYIRLTTPSPSPLTPKTLSFSSGIEATGHAHVNASFQNGASFDNLEFESVSEIHAFTNMWYVEIYLKKPDNSPGANAAIMIKDVYDKQVYFGYADSNGKARMPLPEYQNTNGIKKNYNPFSITAVLGSMGSFQQLNADGNKAITMNLVEGMAVDINPPSISGVVLNKINPSEVAISWNTNEPASSQGFYDLRQTFEFDPINKKNILIYSYSSAFNADLSTAHTVNLKGLSSNSFHYYSVVSIDEMGNIATSTPASFMTDVIPGAVIQNPGFESCTANLQKPTGWSVSNVNFTGCYNSGAHLGTWRSYASTSAYLSQPLSLQANKKYAFRVYAQISGGIQVSTLSISSSPGSGDQFCSNTTQSDGWKQVECIYSSPIDQTIYYNLKSGPPEGAYSRFDDASIAILGDGCASQCTLQDTNCDNAINDAELGAATTKWQGGLITLTEFLETMRDKKYGC
jgi:hypothetical protein